MAELDVGSAATAGFRLIGRHFGAIVIWGVLAFILGLIPAFLAIPQYLSLAEAAGGRAGGLDPSAFAASPLIALLNVIIYFVSGLLIQAAVFRAVSRPESGGFGFLRLGSSELLLAVYWVVVFILGILALFLVSIVFGVLTFAIGRDNAAAGILVAIPFWLAASVGFIWLFLRLSLVGPMIVATGELRIGEAWALTKGRVLSLFLTWLLNVLIVIGLVLVFFVLFVLVVGVTAGAIGLSSGAMQNPADTTAAIEHMAPALLAGMLALGLLFLAGWILVSAMFSAIAYAPWADVYRQLAPSDAAQTFA